MNEPKYIKVEEGDEDVRTYRPLNDKFINTISVVPWGQNVMFKIAYDKEITLENRRKELNFAEASLKELASPVAEEITMDDVSNEIGRLLIKVPAARAVSLIEKISVPKAMSGKEVKPVISPQVAEEMIANELEHTGKQPSDMRMLDFALTKDLRDEYVAEERLGERAKSVSFQNHAEWELSRAKEYSKMRGLGDDAIRMIRGCKVDYAHSKIGELHEESQHIFAQGKNQYVLHTVMEYKTSADAEAAAAALQKRGVNVKIRSDNVISLNEMSADAAVKYLVERGDIPAFLAEEIGHTAELEHPGQQKRNEALTAEVAGGAWAAAIDNRHQGATGPHRGLDDKISDPRDKGDKIRAKGAKPAATQRARTAPDE